MTDPQFDQWWRSSPEELARAVMESGADVGSRTENSLRTILNARLLEASIRSTKWSQWLAVSTVVLAAATVALAVVAAVK